MGGKLSLPSFAVFTHVESSHSHHKGETSPCLKIAVSSLCQRSTCKFVCCFVHRLFYALSANYTRSDDFTLMYTILIYFGVAE